MRERVAEQARAELDAELGWTDVRAARVRAASLMAWRRQRATRAAPKPAGRRGRLALVGAVGLGLAIASVIVVAVGHHSPPTMAVSAPRVVPSAAPAAEPEPGPEAREVQRDDEALTFVPSRGTASYDAREHRIEVRVGGARIRGQGALFAVAVEASAFQVSVDEGEVSVEAGSRSMRVGAGESLRLRIPSIDPPRAAPSATPDAAALRLMEEADAARRAGDFERAASALRRLLALRPGGSRTAVALFALGGVERARGHLPAAADAYLRCESLATTDALAEDALAEAADTLAGLEPSRARELARRYLREHAHGVHRDRMWGLARE